MIMLGLILVVSVAVVAALGVVAYREAWTLPAGGPAQWGRVAAARVGSIPAALSITAVGGFVAWLASLPVGYLAKSLESSVDKPAFRFVQHHADASSKFTALNSKLTVFGNNSEIQLIGLIAVILLAFAYRRRWWIPVVVTVVVFYGERYAQRSLAKVVDRGHPPTALGTFPSGGVARIISVYGALLLLALVLFPALTHAWRVGLLTAIGLAATVEAFTRYYLSKHWLTDAVGALVFGYLLLAVAAAAIGALTYSMSPQAGSTAPGTRRTKSLVHGPAH